MLEKYFKSKEDFEKQLDRTYDPVKFERQFTQFLNQLAKTQKRK